MKDGPRLLSALVAPAAVNVPVVAMSAIAYASLGASPQMDSDELWLLKIVGLVAGAAVCVWLVYPIVRWNRLLVLAAAPVLSAYAIYKGMAFQTEALALLGFGCCRESLPSVASVLEIAISPLAPFVMATSL
jgi:hypothetical protein